MQWSAGPHAGFSDVNPWIPVNGNYALFNVEDEAQDPVSILNFWKQVLRTRKLHKDELVYGNFSLVDVDNEKSLTFVKSSEEGSRRFLVALNFSDQETSLFVPDDLAGIKIQLLISTASHVDREEFLSPWEGRLYEVGRST